jgi:hypothetical protein
LLRHQFLIGGLFLRNQFLYAANLAFDTRQPVQQIFTLRRLQRPDTSDTGEGVLRCHDVLWASG